MSDERNDWATAAEIRSSLENYRARLALGAARVLTSDVDPMDRPLAACARAALDLREVLALGDLIAALDPVKRQPLGLGELLVLGRMLAERPDDEPDAEEPS